MRRLSIGIECFVATAMLIVSVVGVRTEVDASTIPEERVPDSSAVADASLAQGFFTENAGQLSNEEIRYYLGAAGLHFGFARSAVIVSASGSASAPFQSGADTPGNAGTAAESPPTALIPRIGISFDGSSAVEPQGRGTLPHRSHYFRGSDPAMWRTNVRNYREVVFPELYPGIDLAFSAAPEGAKYEFRLDPHADLDRISVRLQGIEELLSDGEGGLVARTSIGDLRDASPVAYQGDGMPVECRHVLREATAFSFACRGWDSSLPLVIDPLVYSTYLGGGDVEDIEDMAVDQSGNAYVTGRTQSVDFPSAPGVYDATLNGFEDCFVAKLTATGSLVYSTFLGGNSSDDCYAIAVDAAGNAYLTGLAGWLDFPVTTGAFDVTFDGGADAFAAKLSAAGDELLYCTYLGGNSFDDAWGIEVDAAGNAYIVGRADSTDFPTTVGAYDPSPNGASDVFIAKVNADGTDLVYATYLGGGDNDYANGIAIDSSGNAYVVGRTGSTDFPVTASAYDPSPNGGMDVFVSKLDPTGGSLEYSTFIGGSLSDEGEDIAVDDSGMAYLTGDTESANFPTSAGAFDRTHVASADVFAAKLDTIGGGLVYSTFLGGSAQEFAYGIAIDATGRAYLAGITNSVDFPMTPGAFDNVLADWEAFVTALNETGTGLVNSTFLGGSAGEGAMDIAVDAGLSVLVAGGTESSDFPTTAGAHDSTLNGTSDAFVAKFSRFLGLNRKPVADAGPDQVGYRTVQVALDGSGSSDPDGDPMTFRWTEISGPPVSLSGANAATASFVPVELGTYTLQLLVDDGQGGNSTDNVSVVIINRDPSVDAGADQFVTIRTAVTLSAVASDLDGDTLTYIWTQVTGSAVTLSGANTDSSVFTPTEPGIYTFNVAVDDGFGGTATDTIMVEVWVPEGPSSPEISAWLIAILIFVVLSLLLAFMFWRRRRRGSRFA